MTDRRYQIRSGIYGVCVGDALGVSAEFRKKDAAIILSTGTGAVKQTRTGKKKSDRRSIPTRNCLQSSPTAPESWRPPNRKEK